MRNRYIQKSTINSFLSQAYILLVPVAAITNMLQNLPGLGLINRLYVVGFTFLVFCRLCLRKISKVSVLVMLLAAILTVASFAMTTWPFSNAAVIPYFLLCLVSLLLFSEDYALCIDTLQKYKRFFSAIMYVWALLILVSMPLSSSWQLSDTGQRYFVSWTESSFQLMPTALLMTSLAGCMNSIRREKINYIVYLISFIVAFTSGSRTYFFLILILIYILVVRRIESRFVRTTLTLIYLGICLFAFAGSGVAAKFEYVVGEQGVQNSGGLLNSITSGRSDMWGYEISAFEGMSFLNQLFGNGFDTIYNINKMGTGLYLWAHNDFLNILITHGVFGLILYLYTCAYSIKTLSNRAKLTTSSIAIVVLIWLFNAFFNMFYTYMCAFLSILFQMIGLRQSNEISE